MTRGDQPRTEGSWDAGSVVNQGGYQVDQLSGCPRPGCTWPRLLLVIFRRWSPPAARVQGGTAAAAATVLVTVTPELLRSGPGGLSGSQHLQLLPLWTGSQGKEVDTQEHHPHHFVLRDWSISSKLWNL